MTTYAIDSADGNSITTGLSPEVHARRVAQRLANERGESVYLYEIPVPVDEDGEGTGESEEIKPDTIVTVRGARLARRTETGPRGGTKHIYQAESASRVWGYWYDSAAQAIRESNESDRVAR